jgi:hypothetical protein
MRKNKRTIILAKVRRLIREAIRWHELDDGMPSFYKTENYHYAKKCRFPVKGDYPYYTKSSRAIDDIAKKIEKLFEEGN